MSKPLKVVAVSGGLKRPSRTLVVVERQLGFEDLVQYNDGFRTNLIGTPQQIAQRIVELKSVGVDLVLAGFLHFIEEVEYFGKRVLPLVRELERKQHAA